jgi:hypothetical protein
MTVAVAVVLLAATLPAAADVLLSVKCTAGQASSVQEFLVPCSGGKADWMLPGPFDIMAGDVLLGKVTELSIQTDAEPYVNLRCAVEAGATDATFDISSAVVSFSLLSNPQAYASAGVTLTSDADGATITGLFGGMNYQARYNGSTVYANLVAGFSIPGDQTVVHAERKPASGYGTISGTVSSIQSEFNFTLSAFDQASATSRFEVIPEPATFSLLALGGLAMLRRRKQS